MRAAVRNEYSATARQTERWIALGPERDLVAVLALAALLGAVGVLDRHPHDRRSGGARPPPASRPGIRRPVRMITLPSTSSRRILLGLPTSSAPSGVIVAALMP